MKMWKFQTANQKGEAKMMTYWNRMRVLLGIIAWAVSSVLLIAGRMYGQYPGGGHQIFNVSVSASSSRCPGQLYESVSQSCQTPTGLLLAGSEFEGTSVGSATQDLAVVGAIGLTNGPVQPFTVGVSLATDVAEPSGIQTVFTIKAQPSANGAGVTFALFRGPDGYWYTGKVIDGPSPTNNQTPLYYMNKSWDPMSPCVVVKSCTSDTIYVTFLPSGVVMLDEFAILTNSGSGNNVSFTSGRLAYGYPVAGYRSGGGVAPPSAAPLFYSAGPVSIGALNVSQFRPINSSTYPTLVTRVAAWSGNPGPSEQSYRQFILQDQAATAGSLSAVPCNSGLYLNESAPPYQPSRLNTPCNPKTGVPYGSVSPSVLSFNSTSLQGTSSLTATISNAASSGSPLQISSIALALSNPDLPNDMNNFAISSSSGTNCSTSNPLPVGGSCNIQVNFTPQEQGEFRNTQLQVLTNSNGDSEPFAVKLNGSTPVAPNRNLMENFCSTEYLFCQNYGASLIAFGYDQSYVYVIVNGSFTCGLSLADGVDPAPGVLKSCYIVQVPPTGPAGFSNYCGPSGGNCYIAGNTTAVVAFGSGASWRFATMTGSGPCSPSSFANIDPNPGTNESCFYTTNLVTTPPQNLTVSSSLGTTGGVNVPLINVSWSAPSTGYVPGMTYTLSVFNNGTLVGTATGLTSTSWSGDSISNNNFIGLTRYTVAVTPQFGPAAMGSVTTGYVSPSGIYNPGDCAPQGYFCHPLSGMVSYDNGTGLIAYAASQGAITCNDSLVNGVTTNANGGSYYCYQLQTPPTGPNGFQFCGGEGGTCFTNNSADVVVAFGVNGQFEYLNASYSTPCTVAAFGSTDPAPGLVKACFWSSPAGYVARPPGDGSAWCSVEGGQCTLFGGLGNAYEMEFGANGSYSSNVYIISAGGSATIPCNNQYWGDPSPGNLKSCFYKDLRNLPDGFASIATYGQVFTVLSNGSVAYGVNGAYTYKYYAAGQQGTCNELGFQFMVPNNLNTGGSCYFLPMYNLNISSVSSTSPGNAPNGTTPCAQGDQPDICYFVGNAIIYYGTSLSGAFSSKRFIGAANQVYSVPCNPSSFGGDPAPGYQKACFYSPGPVAGAATATPIMVNLEPVGNVNAITNDGVPFSSGGMDGVVANNPGNTYSANVLGGAVGWNGQTFILGASNTLNGVSSTTIPLPFGTYSTISVLASAVGGNQPSQTFVVSYTDGSTQTFTQGLSDWNTPQSYTGESIAMSMPYRDTSTGVKDARNFNLYGYSFQTDKGRTVQSLQLPNNRNVVVTAVNLQ